MSHLPEVNIFINVRCPEEGASGDYSIIMYEEGHAERYAEAFCNITKMRMNILLVIRALETLKGPHAVTVWCDPDFLDFYMTEGWVCRWKSDIWDEMGPEDADNPNLWERLLKIYQTHEVQFDHIANHSVKKDSLIHEEPADETVMQESLPVEQYADEIAMQEDFPLVISCGQY